MKKIFVMAGEASGDIHAGRLVSALKRLSSSLTFFGVGGEQLKKEGVELIYDYSDFVSMGFVEPVLKLFFYRKALKNIPVFITENHIDTVILIDFPGFNLQLAQQLKKKNIKVIYYISPQIWAWHYSRIKKIRKNVDAMIVFYPFEEEIYRKEGVRAYFAGNPLVDNVAIGLEQGDEILYDSNHPLICLMPGSRVSEIQRHVPAMLEAACMLKNKYSCSFLIPVLNHDSVERIKKYSENPLYADLDISFIYNNTYKAMEKSDFLIMSSGTATLEGAVVGKPMVVIYKVDIVSELLGRMLIRVKDISLVNIVAGKRICPELLQRDMNGKNIFKEVSAYLDNNDKMSKIISEINVVRSKLGDRGAINRIADIVLSLINE
ncbi:MAG: lipid-A-disaccharide synthase [Spirochaetes bacterium]|nr:lipid-A-disaccharide synthase [Spirochaetota bacterium]